MLARKAANVVKIQRKEEPNVVDVKSVSDLVLTNKQLPKRRARILTAHLVKEEKKIQVTEVKLQEI
jgi:hypothetical protein